MIQSGHTKSPWSLMALGALSSGITTAVFSHDWCWAAIASGLLGALFAWALSWIADHSPAILHCLTRVRKVLVVLFAGLAIGIFYPLRQPAIFERVFEIPPPAGVYDLHADKYYGGGPGDQAILIRFIADAEAIRQIVAAPPLKNNRVQRVQLERYYGGREDWPALIHRVFSRLGEAHGGVAWHNIPHMSDPQLYEWHKGNSGLESIKLLWDAVSGKAYALYTLG